MPNPITPDTTKQPVRLEEAMYGGDSFAHTATGTRITVPFALPGELVEPIQPFPENVFPPRILEPSPDRTEPQCVHFGTCGGCQYQMATYPTQLAMKEAILRDLLHEAKVALPPDLHVLASPEPYGYRNRIRLRVRRFGEHLRLGYSVRGTTEFLPITMCPIAAPLLWRAAQAFLEADRASPRMANILDAVDELELFCAGDESRLQATLLCPGKRPPDSRLFMSAMGVVQALCPELTGAGLVRTDPRSGRALGAIAHWGADGLPYRVDQETYWITRGGFFQVNRFLLPTLIQLVCGERSGALAWDLFAGVGLFSRVLARSFTAVTAVESSPIACADLRRSLGKLGPQHQAAQTSTLEFLRRAVMDRQRPELVVLDPPRAGAGEEACRLLARLAPAEIVYLSCDPTTLARDLAILTASGYTLSELYLIDLFPQTYHLETLAVLRRSTTT